ncbi:MAG: glycosyltransferase family 1 protein, partial [Longimicrobiales bacterium]
MRAVQVSWHRDPRGRPPAELLDAWPTLAATAAAAVRAGVDVNVVQAANQDAVVEHAGVRIEF